MPAPGLSRHRRLEAWVPQPSRHAADQPNEGVQAADSACIRRFDENRRHSFRYGLFVHALGIQDPLKLRAPRSVSGASSPTRNGAATSSRSASGTTTAPTFMQTSTAVHEIGTRSAYGTRVRAYTRDPAPNYKPKNQSVMNYLFQVRGLDRCGGSRNRVVGHVSGNQNENGSVRWRWTDLRMAPLSIPRDGSRAHWQVAPRHVVGTTPATRHCDGTILHDNPADPDFNPADTVPMVRVRRQRTPSARSTANATERFRRATSARIPTRRREFQRHDEQRVTDGVFTGFSELVESRPATNG